MFPIYTNNTHEKLYSNQKVLLNQVIGGCNVAVIYKWHYNRLCTYNISHNRILFKPLNIIHNYIRPDKCTLPQISFRINLICHEPPNTCNTVKDFPSRLSVCSMQNADDPFIFYLTTNISQ